MHIVWVQAEPGLCLDAHVLTRGSGFGGNGVGRVVYLSSKQERPGLLGRHRPRLPGALGPLLQWMGNALAEGARSG